MLKSLREMTLEWPRLPEPESLRASLGLLIRFGLLAALAFVLSRASLVSLAPGCALAPFAMALFAAGLLAGLNPLPLLTGCVLGAIGEDIGHFNLALPTGCAVILAGSLISGIMGPRLGRIRAALRRAPENQPRSPNDGELCVALTGLGALLPGLVGAGGEILPSVQATAAALAALASASFIRELIECRMRRRRVSAGARIGAWLLGLAVEAGVCAISAPAAMLLGTLALTLLWPVGALAGPGLGAAALMITGDARYATVLALCGAAVQLGERSKELARAATVVAVGAASALFLSLSYAELAGLCLGPVVALLVPGEWQSASLRWLRCPPERCDPDQLAALLRSDAAERLRAMSAAFGDLAEGYLTPASMPDEQALMASLRENLCEGCPGYADCWAGSSNAGARLLCDLVAMAVEDEGAALLDDEPPVALARRCRRARMLPERVGAQLREFARARRDELKRAGENRLISAQFLQAQQLLDALAEAQSRPIRLRSRQARRAVVALERADVPIADALMLDGRRQELVLTLREGRWTEAMTERACRTLGQRYAPAGAWGSTLRLARQPGLSAAVRAVSAARDPDDASGDCHLTAMLDDARMLIMICDGMGSGEAAGREASKAARLLGRFLAAGAAWSLAVETVNALLLNASAEDMFSTVDMLILNLCTGMAECVKLAACPSLISREGEIQRVEGGRLPLGILDQVQPAATRVRLMPGDVVLMASDGVMDAVDPAALNALLASPGEDMDALAEQVLALAQSTGDHRDDMTAVCVRVGVNGDGSL